jgi:hypothetical protein
MDRNQLQMLPRALLDWVLRIAERRRSPIARALPRWLGRILVAALALVILVLAITGGDVLGKVATSLLTALVVGAFAYVWFYSWTSEQATRRLREEARRRPELLFPFPPRIGSAKRVKGRDEVIMDITASLQRRFQAGPQVIVADTGAGKTSFLLGLAHHLAEEHNVLPIVLSLRSRDKVDFAELAKARFRESIDPYLRSEDQAEKLWRWMCRGGRIAVLADDLDRAALDRNRPDPSKAAARAAIDAARRRKLPLVVTSRREGVPPNLPQPPLELPPLELSPEEASQYVLEGEGKRGGVPTEIALAHIDRGRLLSNAFYIEVLAELVRLGRLPELPPASGEHAVRVALLATWRTSLIGDRTVPAAVKQKRAQSLERLDRFAAARLGPSSEGYPQGEWLNDLHAGQRLGVIEVDEEGSYRFVHDVVHAYFAAQAFVRDMDAWKQALQNGADSARVQLALVLAAAESLNAQFCADVCGGLLEGSQDMPDEQRLLRATAAAEVARAGSTGETRLADSIAKECVAALGAATPIAKRAALDQLSGLGGEQAVDALWHYAGDADYGVRWRAVRRLVERCSSPQGELLADTSAYEVLAPQIDTDLATAEACLALPEAKRPDDWDPAILPLKHMAWMLPALRTMAARTGGQAPTRLIAGHLQKLLELEQANVTRQRGLEASIAQGFKVDARLYPDAPVDADALAMLERSKFWYSRLNLLHAITLRVIEAGGRAREATEVKEHAETEPHPFVRVAARFCVAAIEAAKEGKHDEALEYLWDDEGVVVSSRPRHLAPEAIQLVGDISVLLNLNETGTADQREAFGTNNNLPFCMSQSRHRRELFDPELGCHSCGFDLCPFRPAPGRSAHREISRAFCSHQRLYARHSTASRWGSRVGRRALQDFWTQLESLARM